MKRFFLKIRKGISKYLERLAVANRKNFGDTRPDCCSFHKPGKQN